MCRQVPKDKWPVILVVRLKALAERRAALVAEIKAHFGG